MCLRRLAEEIAPIAFHIVRTRRLAKREGSLDILTQPSFARYGELTEEQASKRLAEERARAAALDEKTFKLTLSLAIGMTVLGTAITALIDKVPNPWGRLLIAIGLAISIAYIMLGGFLALGAMRTVASYGYRTTFLQEISISGEPVHSWAEALARQETASLRRHLRNEAAYQMLRNGFVALLITLAVFGVAFGRTLVDNILSLRREWPSVVEMVCEIRPSARYPKERQLVVIGHTGFDLFAPIRDLGRSSTVGSPV